MTNIAIDMPTSIKVAMGRDSGTFLSVETKRIPAKVWIAIMTAGVKVILINTYNGEGAAAKHEAKLAKAQKKLDAWYGGEFAIVEKGESYITAMREVYIDDTRAKTGQSQKEVEADIKTTVATAFGAKESATFGRFLDALATMIGKEEETPVEEVRERIETQLLARVAEVAAEREKAAKKVDVSKLALEMFKKPAKA
jgi:hypothetical protein